MTTARKKQTAQEGKKQGTSLPIVDSLATALHILDFFSREEPELSLRQLSERTGLYKSRVHRLCGTLVSSGFLLRTESSCYRLGPKLMTLGKIYENTNSLIAMARPIMQELARESRESVALFQLNGDKAICLTREFGPSRLVFAIQPGDNMHLHASAAGRVLLAYASTDLQEQVLGVAEFERLTALTITDPQRIRNELAALKRRGVAVNRSETELEIAAIAAPVFNHNLAVETSLAIVGPVQRFAFDNEEEIAAKLLGAAQKISILLGAPEQRL
ncbi:MAG: IclR family transcriptional regulator [Desulfopila sp.]